MKKFNWEKAYKDMELTKSLFPSGTSLKTNFDGFKWLTEEIIIDNTDELPQAWEEEGFRAIKKVQRINLYLEEVI